VKQKEKCVYYKYGSKKGPRYHSAFRKMLKINTRQLTGF